MGKAEDLQKKMGKNIAESVSKGPASGQAPSGVPARRETPGHQKGATHSGDALVIEVSRIIADPDQPRREFDLGAIDRMAASLLKYGQIMPIAVRWSASADRYIIVAGERRWRGAVQAGIATLKAEVHKGSVDTGDLLALQLIENLLREDLSAMDQARAYRNLMDLNGWSGAKLATELHINQPRVVQALALLDLPDPIKERVELEELSATAAYELSKIADPVVQEEVAAKVVDQGLTRDETREAVRQVTSAKGGARNPGKGRGGKESPRGKAKDKPPTVWKDKDKDFGFTLTIERKKGIQPQEVLEFLRAVTKRVEEKLAGVA